MFGKSERLRDKIQNKSDLQRIIRRTAASVSAIIFRDFSRSRFSWAARLISEARSRRFSV